jgi:hypothetical protein
MARGGRASIVRKRHFGALFASGGDARTSPRGSGEIPEVEIAQAVAPEERRRKKQNARPVAGIARFNVPILVNAHEGVNENLRATPGRLNGVPGER